MFVCVAVSTDTLDWRYVRCSTCASIHGL